jgi:hypothetical protein
MLTKLSIHLGNLEAFPLVTESGMDFCRKAINFHHLLQTEF